MGQWLPVQCCNKKSHNNIVAFAPPAGENKLLVNHNTVQIWENIFQDVYFLTVCPSTCAKTVISQNQLFIIYFLIFWKICRN